MSLQKRLMLLVFLAVVPGALIQIDSEVTLRASREAEVHQMAKRLASLIGAEQGRIVEGVRQVLVTLGRTDAVRSGDVGRCQGLLNRLRDDYPAHQTVMVAGTDGTVRCATDPAVVGVSIANRASVRLARERGGFVLGEHAEPLPGGAAALPFVLPYRDADGNEGGVIKVLIDLGWLESYVAAKPLPDGAVVTIVDRKGTVLARVPELPGIMGSGVPDHYRPLLTAEEPGTVEMPGLDGVMRILGYQPLGYGADGLFVAVGVDKALALAPIQATMLREFIILGGVLLLTLALAWWGAERFLRRPLAQVAAAAQRWRDGDLSARTGIRNRSEIGQFARAFDAMADDLQRQTALREEANAAAHKMAAVLASTTDGVFEVDREWRITFMNDRARVLIADGRSLVGKRLWDAFPATVGTVFADRYRHAMAQQEPVEFEGHYPPLDAWYAVRVFPSRDGLAVFFQDVTARKRAEAALKESEERLRLALRSADAGIWDWDIVGGAIRWSPEYCALYGMNPETVRPSFEAWIDSILPEDRASAENAVRSMLESRRADYYAEFRVRHPQRGVRWLAGIGRATYADDGTPLRLSGINLDITQRKAMEQALQAAKDSAERANLAKTKFLAAASHDLRQPIQSLYFFAAALAPHVQPRGATVLQHLERGLDAVKGLLDSLLDVSRLDAGLVNPQVEDFPIADVLEELAVAYAPVAAGKGLHWLVTPCIDSVRSDRTLLLRMLRNLVENAIRYTGSGTVAITCRSDGEAMHITVRDTGIGIPPDHVERIFEEFHQVGNPERDRAQGLGLGLAIVRRLSQLLEHPVELESEVGRGSAFHIRVPFGAATALPAKAAAQPVTSGEGRLALLVDDDAIVLMGLKAILEEWGYEVLAAGSADQAIEFLAQDGRQPDIVISDYRLREGRVGTEAILRVRAQCGADIPGVILTGETAATCRHDAAAHGLSVVHKPITPRELGAALERHLNAAE